MTVLRHSERKKIYHRLFVYEQRREQLLKKFGGTAQYSTKVKQIQRTIDQYKAAIKRIDARTTKVIAIGNALAYFSGHNVKNSSRSRLIPRYVKGIFFKYGMENGITGSLLAEYVGTGSTGYPSETRMWFTRSFKTNPEYREQYKRFSEFIKTYQNENK